MSMLELNSWTFSEEQDFVFVVVRGEDAENFLQGMLTQNVADPECKDNGTDRRSLDGCLQPSRTYRRYLFNRQNSERFRNAYAEIHCSGRS